MANCISSKSIPEIGEKVSKVVVSGDETMVWVTFESGKTVISHIYTDTGRQGESGGGSAVLKEGMIKGGLNKRPTTPPPPLPKGQGSGRRAAEDGDGRET